jgi:hypothetical protein
VAGVVQEALRRLGFYRGPGWGSFIADY